MGQQKKAFNDLSEGSRVRLLNQMDSVVFEPLPFFRGGRFWGALVVGLYGMALTHDGHEPAFHYFEPIDRILPTSYWLASVFFLSLIAMPIGEWVWRALLQRGLPWRRGIHLLPLHKVDGRSHELVIDDLTHEDLANIRPRDGKLYATWKLDGKPQRFMAADNSETRARIARLESFVAAARNARDLREISWLKAISPFSKLPNPNTSNAPVSNPINGPAKYVVLFGCLIVMVAASSLASAKKTELDQAIFEQLDRMPPPNDDKDYQRQKAHWEAYIESGGLESNRAQGAINVLPAKLEERQEALERLEQERIVREAEAREQREKRETERLARQQAAEQERRSNCNILSEIELLAEQIEEEEFELNRSSRALEAEFSVLSQRGAYQWEIYSYKTKEAKHNRQVGAFNSKIRKHDQLVDRWSGLSWSQRAACN